MKKTYAAVLLVISIIASSFTIFQDPATNSLPDLPLVTTAGKTLNAKQLKGKNILVVFLPDCDHCQRQATEYKKELAKFKGYNFTFISSASTDQLKKFATDYKLAGIPNVSFAQTSVDGIRTNFGRINTPSSYIYSENGKLKKHFIGETPVSEIVKAL